MRLLISHAGADVQTSWLSISRAVADLAKPVAGSRDEHVSNTGISLTGLAFSGPLVLKVLSHSPWHDHALALAGMCIKPAA